MNRQGPFWRRFFSATHPLRVSFGTVMLEEAEKMALEGRLELYRSGNAYYFRPRVVNKTQ